MFLELESVFNTEGESKQFDYEFSIDDECFVTPVRVSGSVFNKTGIVNLKANAKFDYSTSCARCSKPLLKHFTVPVEHILLAHAANDDDDDFIVLDGVRLDLDELVSEDIYLSMPSRFLCKPDCKGLCSICGADLNVTECGCKPPSDPRWDVLKEMLNE